MPQALIALFTNLAGIIGGTLNGVLGIAVAIMQKGTQAAFKFHQEGISLARDLGMGLNQANAYTKVLTERTQVLAQKYGVTAEAIKAVQRNISETTGKQLLLNNAQAEGFVQANKLVGEQTTNKFMDTIMNGMGGQVSAVPGAISKAYATAAKQGLNAQKFSKIVADNLSMANRLNFKNGVDSITRMAAMAEKFGLSMKSVETAANQFMELDDAIEHSAHLQMLGGSIGAAFSNPLQNAYESMYDPEALAKKMEDAMKGMATFDRKKGYATMSAMNQEILRNYAKQLSLNPEEVIANAKKMAEVRYKENAFVGDINKYAGNGKDREARRNFIINNSQVTPEGNLQVNGKDISTITEKEWKDMMAFDGKSDTDILKEQALHLTSIDEALTGNAESVVAAFAKGLALDENAQRIIRSINGVGNKFQQVAENLGDGANKALNGILNWVYDNKDTLKDIANGIIKVSRFLADNWKGLLIAIGAWKLLLKPALGMRLGGTTLGGKFGGKLGGRALGGLRTIGGRSVKSLWDSLKTMWKIPLKLAKSSIRATKAFKGAITHGSGIKGAFSASKRALSRAGALKTLGRIAKSGGVGLAGAMGGMGVDYLADKGKIQKGGKAHQTLKATATAIEYGAVGAMLGPIGAGIGAAVGAVKGAYDAWKSLPENADKDFIDYAKSVANGIVEGGKAAFSKIGSALSAINKDIEERGGYLNVAFNAIITPIRTFINALEGIARIIIHPIDAIKNGWNDLKNWWNSDNKLERIWNKAKDVVMGEKHADGGVVGAKPKQTVVEINNPIEKLHVEKHDIGGIVGGNSFTGDKILTGLNSGEMVLNKGQQAQLFKFINNASNILTKIGESKGVTYYSAYSRTSNLSSIYDTNRILSIVDNKNLNQNDYNTTNNNLSTFVNNLSNVLNKFVNDTNSISNYSYANRNIGGVENNNVRYLTAFNPSFITSSIKNTNDAESYLTISKPLYSSSNVRNVGGSESNNIRNLTAFGNSFISSDILNNDNVDKSIKQRYNATHNNEKINTLNSILSTIFNNNSNIVSSALNTNNEIKTIPFGENSFRRIPKSIISENEQKVSEIAIKDINLNVNGTIKLDSGNNSKNLDINQLLNDAAFVSHLKDLIAQSFSTEMNGGRLMLDNSARRGGLNTTLWGH